MAPRKLGREEIKRLFEETDNWFVANGTKGQQIKIAICGGAAIAMMNTQRVSVDVDIFSGKILLSGCFHSNPILLVM